MAKKSSTSVLLSALALRGLFVFLSFIFGSAVCLFILRIFIKSPRKFFARKKRDNAPTCLTDPQYGQHGFADVNGVRLHYVANGKQQAPLLLMIHGYPECWWSWRYQLRHFSRSYYAVAFDTRGYNQSSKPKGVSQYREEVLIEDVRALIEHLGYEKAIVVGHDWGAAIAWQFADTYGSMVEKLVIMDCPPIQLRLKRLVKPEQLSESWRLFFYLIPAIPEYALSCYDVKAVERMRTEEMRKSNDNTISDEDLEVYKHALSRPDLCTYPINYYRAALSLQSIIYRLTNQAKHNGHPVHIRAKTLILWGTDDPYVHVSLAYESQALCDDAQVKLIEGASHCVQQHKPILVNDAISKFLRE